MAFADKRFMDLKKSIFDYVESFGGVCIGVYTDHMDERTGVPFNYRISFSIMGEKKQIMNATVGMMQHELVNDIASKIDSAFDEATTP